MEWFTESFITIFIMTGVFSFITGIGWGMSSDFNAEKSTLTIWKTLFMVFISLFVLGIVAGNTFLKRTISYKFATTEIVTGTIIDAKGQNSTYYKWKEHTLPNSIASYLSADSVTMIIKLDPWGDKENDAVKSFVISDEKPAKEKPKPVVTTPSSETINKIAK